MLAHKFFLLAFILGGWQPYGTRKAVVTLGWQLRKLRPRDIELFMSGDLHLPLDVWWSSQTQHVQKWTPIFPSHVWQLHLLLRLKALVSPWLLSFTLHIWATREFYIQRLPASSHCSLPHSTIPVQATTTVTWSASMASTLTTPPPATHTQSASKS